MDESDANGEAGGRIELGSASAAPGTLDRGRLPVAELPTGGAERLPVVVANGAEAGPTLWLTGGVHGDEATGVAVVQDAVAAFGDCLADLAGAVVAVPAASPAGLRRNARETYYADEDPNRHFPDADAESARPPKLQERIDARLYAAITGEVPDDAGESADDSRQFAVETVGTNAAADALIDCHTAGVGSEPFAIRDRVLYGDRRSESEAAALFEDLGRLVDAFGLPVVREYPAAEYVEENLQRSTAGAVLNEAGIPAFTAELGAHSVVDDAILDAGVAGAFGVAVELGLLDSGDVPESVGEPGVGVDPAPVEFPVRRFRGPTTDDSGLVRHRVAAGDVFAEGDVLASVVDAAGAERATVRADSDGYVLGRCEGLAVYEGDPIGSLAVRDDGALVVPRDADEE
ncbi:succinylglutamate desuccinylase/aspartoacylase [Halorubrum distributum JCM 9100]|uniref:Succinylglutamate desuccinylase/aspartoacylase n=2 Tax=Halorubrum distributum TaxID=29283 RepID=M0F3A6_9EURY|nr:succinylglutamate desuccinylase/aspartoacylase family protein [Halorubrum distributum]ELZ53843.1 succinylglutamate desuccinylase/aspartoacylase [Halorubrum distributum JCM 9100]ELZ56038.1 succinylglutamate desuccinylase/aspartoacylase [Halorubrum distributum JCM 10118]